MIKRQEHFIEIKEASLREHAGQQEDLFKKFDFDDEGRVLNVVGGGGGHGDRGHTDGVRDPASRGTSGSGSGSGSLVDGSNADSTRVTVGGSGLHHGNGAIVNGPNEASNTDASNTDASNSNTDANDSNSMNTNPTSSNSTNDNTDSTNTNSTTTNGTYYKSVSIQDARTAEKAFAAKQILLRHELRDLEKLQDKLSSLRHEQTRLHHLQDVAWGTAADTSGGRSDATGKGKVIKE
jgi:hypothetical protein